MMRTTTVCLALLIMLAVASGLTRAADREQVEIDGVAWVLAGLNAAMSEIQNAQTPENLADAVQSFQDELEILLAMLPDINGVPFLAWVQLLTTLGDAAAYADTFEKDASAKEHEELRSAISMAQLLKDDFESMLRAEETPCDAGKALVIVYPGFDAHDLKSTISDLLLNGKCVTVAWRVPEAYDLGCGLDPNAAMEQLVYTALGTAFMGNPEFKVDANAGNSGGTFNGVHLVGDATMGPHTRRHPGSPHPNFDRAAIASGTQAGAPIELGRNPLLGFNQNAGPWVRLQNVCDPTSVTMPVYSPLGVPVETFEFDTDPADAGVDRYSSSSSMNYLNLYDPSYCLSGTYWVEIWVNAELGGGFCGSLAFMVQPPQLPPYGYAELYTLPEDGSALTGNVLANDYDINGDPLSAVLVAPPAYGDLDFSSDGSFVYMPAPEWPGEDAFQYELSDGTNEPVLLVPVRIYPSNRIVW